MTNGDVVVSYVLLEKDTGDLFFYDRLGSLVCDVEPPDVRAGVYDVFDSTGRHGRLEVVRRPGSRFEQVVLVWDAAADSAGGLVQLLSDFISSRRPSVALGGGLGELWRDARRIADADS